MDLWQLKVFCKVVETRSFSKAGKAVHLSQPTVSSHIKELETHFDARLIDRLARKAEPTKAGALLYDYARRLIALKDEMEAGMGDFLGTKTGRLMVGGSTIPGGYLLPQVIGGFARLHPDVNITLEIGDTATIIQATLAGQIELGIVGAKTDEGHISQLKLIDDEMCLAVPRDHRWANKGHVSIQDLLSEPFIIREEGSGTLKSLKMCLTKIGHDISELRTVAVMGSTEAVRQGIKSHLGVSILSTIAVAEDVRNGTLQTLAIDGLDLNRSFYLTRHKNRTPSPLCLSFEAFLKKALSHHQRDPQPIGDP
jgi:DNA-binding transcriptional LysR family regulator